MALPAFILPIASGDIAVTGQPDGCITHGGPDKLPVIFDSVAHCYVYTSPNWNDVGIVCELGKNYSGTVQVSGLSRYVWLVLPLSLVYAMIGFWYGSYLPFSGYEEMWQEVF